MGRVSARVIASQAASRQLEALGVSPITVTAPATAREIERARAAAMGAADNWGSHYADAIAAGATHEEAVEAARAASQWKVRQLSITETAEVWSDETARVADAASRHGTVLWKVWDAVLDRRTCPVCGGAHGTAVLATERFPDGEPGAVHPFCRCQTILLTREQLDPVVAEKGAGSRGAFTVITGGRSTRPGAPVQLPAAATSTNPLVVLPGGKSASRGGEERAPQSGRRPRRIDVVPFPGTPAGDKRRAPAVFRPGRPPWKEEVRARKKAQRRAAMGA